MPPSADLLRRLLEQQQDEAVLDLLSPEISVKPATRKNVLSGWRILLRWLRAEGESVLNLRDPEELARAYAAWLWRTYPEAPATVNNRLTQARKLYQALQDKGLTELNPFVLVHGEVNHAHERRRVYTPEEVTRLLAHANREEQALLLLGAHAGLTGPEVRRLRFEDVHALGERIHVGARIVTCTPELQFALQAWAGARGELPLYGMRPHGLLFEEEGRPVTDAQLRAKMFELCRRAGVHYKAWHALRNSAGVKMLGEQDRRSVTEALGLGGRMALRPLVKLSGGGDARRGKKGG
ncbi:tyrosine-type recombinase/integrase [Deinococcus aestuarii]|uniref:tyrosine-type recombinase/integrase n=1 Tax=Deinococcus aestuarii TaxID=2774531 RepID=UPI001C0AC076|nr:integrase [Deinococcus aestuarii]